MKKLSKLFGANLKELRKSQHISQRNFAEKADMSESSIIKIEKGQVAVKFSTLEKLCTALDVPVAALFNDASSNNENLTAEKIKTAINGLSQEKLDLVYNLICDLKKI